MSTALDYDIDPDLSRQNSGFPQVPQAVGVLMQRHGLTVEDATDRLGREAAEAEQDLAAFARAVVRSTCC